jgi:hypothetical protein
VTGTGGYESPRLTRQPRPAGYGDEPGYADEGYGQGGYDDTGGYDRGGWG